MASGMIKARRDVLRYVEFEYSLGTGGSTYTNLKTLIDADLPSGYRFKAISSWIANSSFCLVANCAYFDSQTSLQIRNLGNGSISATLRIYYLAEPV